LPAFLREERDEGRLKTIKKDEWAYMVPFLQENPAEI